MQPRIDEIAPDVFRIATFLPAFQLGFNVFVVRDEEPLLYHTGLPVMFPAVRDAVAQVVDPASLRWIGFSHYEPDECGALDAFLALAPHAQPVCGRVGAAVCIDQVASRRARALDDGEVLVTGRHRFRYLATPHVPHGWDAGLLFDESGRTLFASDLFQQAGPVDGPFATHFMERIRDSLVATESGPFRGYIPYGPWTVATLARLADLEPRTIATMHGGAYEGDGRAAVHDLARVLEDVLAPRAA